MIMIKRLFIALIAVAGISTAAMARDTYAHDASVLPQAAQMTFGQKISRQRLAWSRFEKGFWACVGNTKSCWTTVQKSHLTVTATGIILRLGKTMKIPSAFIPAAIAKYVKTNMSGENIVGIDKDRSGYDIELSKRSGYEI